MILSQTAHAATIQFSGFYSIRSVQRHRVLRKMFAILYWGRNESQKNVPVQEVVTLRPTSWPNLHDSALWPFVLAMEVNAERFQLSSVQDSAPKRLSCVMTRTYTDRRRLKNDRRLEDGHQNGRLRSARTSNMVKRLKNAIKKRPTMASLPWLPMGPISSVSRAVPDLGGKSLVRQNRSLLTATMQRTIYETCKLVLNDLKRA